MNHEPILPTLAGDQCTVHRTHSPVPLRTVQHHIVPKEFGGRTITANLVDVCDTGHYNIHTIIEGVLNGLGTEFSSHRMELALADQGVRGIREMNTAYLLVPVEQAKWADWITASERRVQAQGGQPVDPSGPTQD